MTTEINNTSNNQLNDTSESNVLDQDRIPIGIVHNCFNSNVLQQRQNNKNEEYAPTSRLMDTRNETTSENSLNNSKSSSFCVEVISLCSNNSLVRQNHGILSNQAEGETSTQKTEKSQEQYQPSPSPKQTNEEASLTKSPKTQNPIHQFYSDKSKSDIKVSFNIEEKSEGSARKSGESQEQCQPSSSTKQNIEDGSKIKSCLAQKPIDQNRSDKKKSQKRVSFNIENSQWKFSSQNGAAVESPIRHPKVINHVNLSKKEIIMEKISIELNLLMTKCESMEVVTDEEVASFKTVIASARIFLKRNSSFIQDGILILRYSDLTISDAEEVLLKKIREMATPKFGYEVGDL